MSVAPLRGDTIRQISSAQIISSISSVVKELMENAIDAGASYIDIKLDNNGLDRIEVTDNGSGISRENAPLVCLPSHTSKINSMCDIEKLESYGFRGEALSAICAVAKVTITTRTRDDELAMAYSYDASGKMFESRLAHRGEGTVICVTGLFKSLPVRKQIMSKSKRAQEELKNIEHIVKSLALIHPQLRVTLAHNKCLIWQKSSVANLKLSFLQIVSSSVVKNLDLLHYIDGELALEMLVPRFDSDLNAICLSSISRASFFYVNFRPVKDSKLEKLVMEEFQEYFGTHLPPNKHPYCLISLKVNPATLDVNLEPNKTKVLWHNQESILKIVRDQLLKYFNKPFTGPSSNSEKSKNVLRKEETLDELVLGSKAKKPKLETDINSQDSGFESGQNTNCQNSVEINYESQNINEFEYTRSTNCQNSKCNDGSQDIHETESEESLCPQNMPEVGSKGSPVTGNGELHATLQVMNGTAFSETGGFKTESMIKKLEQPSKESLNQDSGVSHGLTKLDNLSISIFENSHLISSQSELTPSDSLHESVSVLEASHSDLQNNCNSIELNLNGVELPSFQAKYDLNGSCESQKSSSTVPFTTAEKIHKTEISNLSTINSTDKNIKMNCSFSNDDKHTIGGIDESIKKSYSVGNSNDISKFLDGISVSDFLNASPSKENVSKTKGSSSTSVKGTSQNTTSQRATSQHVINQNESTQNVTGQNETDQSTTSCCIRTDEDEEDQKLADFLRSIDGPTGGLDLSSDESHELVENSELPPSHLETQKEGFQSAPDPDKITASQWSKGQVFFNNKPLQGPGVLAEKCGNNQNSSELTQVSNEEVSGKSFVNEKRTFMDVAKELSLKRLKLEKEKNAFELKAKKAQEKLEKLPTTVNSNEGEPVLKSKSKEDLKHWLEYQRRVKMCDSLSLNVMEEKLRASDVLCSNNTIVLFSKLTQPKEAACAWLYQENNHIGLVNVSRLHEVIEYHKLLESLVVPSKTLEKNLAFSEFDIGTDLWKTLLSLPSCTYLENECVVQEVIDQRICYNGLKLILKEIDGTRSVYITSVPQHVSYFGLDEIKETLSLISVFNTLSCCRPTKVKFYMKGEVVRIREQTHIERITKEQVLEWFTYWTSNIRPTDDKCLHQKPILYPLYELGTEK